MDFTAYQLDVIQKHLNKRLDGDVYIVSVEVQGFPSRSDIIIEFPHEFTNAPYGPYMHLYRVDSIKIKNRKNYKWPYFCESKARRFYFSKDCDNLKFNMLCDSPKAAVEYIRYSLSKYWGFRGEKLNRLVDFFDLEVNVRW